MTIKKLRFRSLRKTLKPRYFESLLKCYDDPEHSRQVDIVEPKALKFLGKMLKAMRGDPWITLNNLSGRMKLHPWTVARMLLPLRRMGLVAFDYGSRACWCIQIKFRVTRE
jgi:hypothetical protein